MMGQVKCAYCGSDLEWNGATTCSHCGASQPESTEAKLTLQKRRALYSATPLVLAGLALIAYLAWPTKHATPSSAPIVDTGRGSKAVLGTRIIHVDNPAVRIIPAGVHFEPQDILDTPNGSAELPQFDTRLLVTTHAPRHLMDENGGSVYIAEVRNESPDMVAITPDVTLVLLRKGHEIERATRSYADLVPGVNVPVFFHYDDGAAAAFDEARLIWKPTKAYRLGDAKHAQLIATLNPGLTTAGSGRKMRTHVSCTVQNKGRTAAVSLYAILRDANGLITGFEHSDLSRINTGSSSEVTLDVYTYGAPGVRAELSALPVSEPTL